VKFKAAREKSSLSILRGSLLYDKAWPSIQKSTYLPLVDHGVPEGPRNIALAPSLTFNRIRTWTLTFGNVPCGELYWRDVAVRRMPAQKQVAMMRLFNPWDASPDVSIPNYMEPPMQPIAGILTLMFTLMN